MRQSLEWWSGGSNGVMGKKKIFILPILQHSNTPSFLKKMTYSRGEVSHFFNGLSLEQDIYGLVTVTFPGIKIAHFRAEGEHVPTLYHYPVNVCSKNKLFGPRSTSNAYGGTFRLWVPPTLWYNMKAR
jgi:hypothetical protein